MHQFMNGHACPLMESLTIRPTTAHTARHASSSIRADHGLPNPNCIMIPFVEGLVSK